MGPAASFASIMKTSTLLVWKKVGVSYSSPCLILVVDGDQTSNGKPNVNL